MITQTITSLFSLTAFTTLVSALPVMNTVLITRAGGPAIISIPASCNITDPLANQPSERYIPAATTKSALLYSAYYSSLSTNKTAMSEQCLEQCYGYGNHVECKTAFWGENLVVPAGYYGTPGGQLSTGCLLFNQALDISDFVIAHESQVLNPVARNIKC
jgi:hypothetical protein